MAQDLGQMALQSLKSHLRTEPSRRTQLSAVSSSEQAGKTDSITDKKSAHHTYRYCHKTILALISPPKGPFIFPESFVFQ